MYARYPPLPEETPSSSSLPSPSLALTPPFHTRLVENDVDVKLICNTHIADAMKTRDEVGGAHEGLPGVPFRFPVPRGPPRVTGADTAASPPLSRLPRPSSSSSYSAPPIAPHPRRLKGPSPTHGTSELHPAFQFPSTHTFHPAVTINKLIPVVQWGDLLWRHVVTARLASALASPDSEMVPSMLHVALLSTENPLETQKTFQHEATVPEGINLLGPSIPAPRNRSDSRSTGTASSPITLQSVSGAVVSFLHSLISRPVRSDGRPIHVEASGTSLPPRNAGRVGPFLARVKAFVRQRLWRELQDHQLDTPPWLSELRN
ncbi:hypothetical protein DACRYDRAFT_112037 [Dacryopinax primogenitus]|uniref:Uncharacterized protein n=1 Tax=Dacryopinax primogenitus (strain DJM 731) TaxID=1858805 RepID=M5FN99_DACPD|nr:uncharacterized protein DACRYDRAFT_112037 [Dacryopinax primogenitus]EJT97075.1 hypothetical protein DACRYDRAFT_112037 [Dacryopinax primogenitus]